MAKSEEGQSALGPYRVLDLTNERGVFCTKILAALGADVIRIEPPGGDATRRIGPFYHDEPDPEKSLHWFTYNLNKRSITLNIECVTGQELFKRLVKTADFVVECFRPGHLDNLGLGYADLSSINPRIILTSITPFGLTGPYSQFKGSNLISSAASGYLRTAIHADRPPVGNATPLADIYTGLEAASATMVAHWYRQRTGEGQHIDISGQEGLMLQARQGIASWRGQGILTSRGDRVGGRKTFNCKDGYVSLTTPSIRDRRALREWFASEGMAGDLYNERWDRLFTSAEDIPEPYTAEQQAHIDDLFQAFALNHTKEELMMEGQRREIMVVKTPDVREVVEDAHFKERGYFVNIEHPELNDTIVYGGAPFKSSEMSWRYWRRAPLIGEHNQEIYVKELGISQQELVTLKEGGVL